MTERKRTPRPGDGGVDEFAGSERACLLGQDDHDLVKLAALRPMVSVPTLDCGRAIDETLRGGASADAAEVNGRPPPASVITPTEPLMRPVSGSFIDDDDGRLGV